MRKGVATPERNNSPKLTMVVQTRSPLEAFNMLRMGHPIDQMAGYYQEKGMNIPDDFYMMDQIGKLHALAELREITMQKKSDIEALQQEARAAQEFTTKNNNSNGEETKT